MKSNRLKPFSAFIFYSFGSISTFLFILLFISLQDSYSLKSNYENFRNISTYIRNFSFSTKKNKLIDNYNKNCLPNYITELPINSSVIIGHAYGRPPLTIKDSINISPKVYKFLNKNRARISTVFFTGDIFFTPSLYKWKKLYKDFSSDFEIIIAPGNHEVARSNNLRRDLFNAYVGRKQPSEFPFYLNRSQFNIIVDDSTVRQTYLNQKNFNLQHSKLYENLLIIRHHASIKEVSIYSDVHYNLTTKSELENRFGDFSKVIIISGNAGIKYPDVRTFCYRHSNILHLESGIGEFDKDNVLVLYKGRIYRYLIRN